MEDDFVILPKKLDLKKIEAPAVSMEEIADAVELMKKSPLRQEFPVVNRFTPGLYSRELRLPRGAMVITMVHKTEHQFIVSAGKVWVWSPGEKKILIEAPYHGVTKPGTVRLAQVEEDLVWTTFHPTNETDVKKLEEQLVMEPRTALEFKETKWLS